MRVFMSGIFVAPVQEGVAKVVGLVLVAPRHPLQIKVELHIGDHGKLVHLIASVEESRILWNIKDHIAVAHDGEQIGQFIGYLLRVGHDNA